MTNCQEYSDSRLVALVVIVIKRKQAAHILLFTAMSSFQSAEVKLNQLDKVLIVPLLIFMRFIFAFLVYLSLISTDKSHFKHVDHFFWMSDYFRLLQRL